MSDLMFQDFSTVQSDQQQSPVTMPAATTITPTTLTTYLTGTTNVSTIVPPVKGQHILYLIFTNVAPGDLLTNGNISLGTTTIVTDIPVGLLYNPTTAKYTALLSVAP